MTRLLLGLSRLREHKFMHNFQNCIDPLYSCGMAIESTSHFFLHCPLFDDKRITPLSTLRKTDCKLIETNESSLTETLLFDNSLFDSENIWRNLVLTCLTITKYSCISNHSFTLSEFFNLFMVFAFRLTIIVTITFFYSHVLLEFFCARWLFTCCLHVTW